MTMTTVQEQNEVNAVGLFIFSRITSNRERVKSLYRQRDIQQFYLAIYITYNAMVPKLFTANPVKG